MAGEAQELAAKPRNWRRVLASYGLVIALAILVAVACALATGMTSILGLILPLIIAAAPIIAILWFFAICIHEAGHYVAGKLVGLRLEALWLAPIRFTRGAKRPEVN